eukprot:CAMPEP_0171627170 /NCGR_PEP_ID=MMETSP0990-20121206/20573_1 /TAXON_ID=483369 /ORGANISM="non described non described, Strain CCMP2098" /LENGTH=173 /DNA_ID=CAMNT_0012194895 /DNA_START=192 /DNA_END=713 /DNA_ORIENTATION=+
MYILSLRRGWREGADKYCAGCREGTESFVPSNKTLEPCGALHLPLQSALRSRRVGPQEQLRPVERLVPGHGHPVEGTPDPRRRFQQLFGVLQHVSVGQYLWAPSDVHVWAVWVHVHCIPRPPLRGQPQPTLGQWFDERSFVDGSDFGTHASRNVDVAELAGSRSRRDRLKSFG